MNAHQKWCNRLLVRNHLTFRSCPHICQEPPENFLEKKDQIHKIKWSLS